MPRPIIVDAHEDLAYNALILGRDYSRSASETRRLESGSPFIEQRDNTMLGWPEYRRGRVCLVFATLFALPVAKRSAITREACYSDPGEARRICRRELDSYMRLSKEKPDKFAMIRTLPDLDRSLALWRGPDEEDDRPVGLLILMEGAEAIRDPGEVEEWWGLGVRAIGPAWMGNRYCGGWLEPGPLTRDGRDLLKAMANFSLTLDISHMDEEAALQAIGLYPGPIIASHSNAAALITDLSDNRHLSDRVLRGLIERQGVVGVVPYNCFLRAGWEKGDGREGISLDHLISHIDHICQLAGDARHVGIGSDFDGGFGLESVPIELDSIADLQKLTFFLGRRGYSESDIAAILGGNFIERLEGSLPPA